MDIKPIFTPRDAAKYLNSPSKGALRRKRLKNTAIGVVHK